MRFVLSLLILCFSVQLWALPATVNFQGKLVDNNGVPVTTGSQSFTIRIYDAASGGNLIYTETHSVPVDDGAYKLEIGNGSGGTPAYGPSMFNTGGERWIEVQVDTETLTPRHQILASPFSVNSQLFQGSVPTDFASAGDLQNVLDQLKVICLQSGGAWSNVTNSCTGDVSSTVDVLPGGTGFIPVSSLQFYGPDACDEDHYHGTGVDCNGITALDPGGDCGHGTVSQVLTINALLCLGG